MEENKPKYSLRKLGFKVERAWTKAWLAVTDLNWFQEDWVPRTFQIPDLIATQDYIELSGLVKANPKKEIYVVKYRDKLYIRDGHHRTVNAKLLGRKTIQGYLVEMA